LALYFYFYGMAMADGNRKKHTMTTGIASYVLDFCRRHTDQQS